MQSQELCSFHLIKIDVHKGHQTDVLFVISLSVTIVTWDGLILYTFAFITMKREKKRVTALFYLIETPFFSFVDFNLECFFFFFSFCFGCMCSTIFFFSFLLH